ncbi:hypothetical protein Nepgr_015871 [Nepenthes gracilis]|uniref:Uncharacterized protein n=1 Tax=Nepenthes gracilis TaxID=150966 RepID=A0AAD3SLN6_NEPGR|nr:hypothetical protein Nepgr_015871 [Nepenthes gracilis]
MYSWALVHPCGEVEGMLSVLVCCRGFFGLLDSYVLSLFFALMERSADLNALHPVLWMTISKYEGGCIFL